MVVRYPGEAPVRGECLEGTGEGSRARQDGERSGADRCRAPAHRRRGWALYSSRSRWPHGIVRSPGSGKSGDAFQRCAGAIYALHQGRISRLFPDITIPNAICFSADGKVGYFADTATNIMHRVPLDASTGLPAGEPAAFIRHTGIGGL